MDNKVLISEQQHTIIMSVKRQQLKEYWCNYTGNCETQYNSDVEKYFYLKYLLDIFLTFNNKESILNKFHTAYGSIFYKTGGDFNIFNFLRSEIMNISIDSFTVVSSCGIIKT